MIDYIFSYFVRPITYSHPNKLVCKLLYFVGKWIRIAMIRRTLRRLG